MGYSRVSVTRRNVRNRCLVRREEVFSLEALRSRDSKPNPHFISSPDYPTRTRMMSKYVEERERQTTLKGISKYRKTTGVPLDLRVNLSEIL